MVFQSKPNYLTTILFLVTAIMTWTIPTTIFLNTFAVTILVIIAVQSCITYKATIEKDQILYEHKLFLFTLKKRIISLNSIDKIELEQDVIIIYPRSGKSFPLSLHSRNFIIEMEKLAETNRIPFVLVHSKKGIFFKLGASR